MDKEDKLPAVLVPPELEEVARFYDVSRLERIRHSTRRSNTAVQDTFDLIGGVPALAVWADANRGEFYTKLYTKTIQGNLQQEHSGEITVYSKVPRTAIDGDYEDVTPDD